MSTAMPLGPHNDANPFNPDCREPGRYHITRAGATELEVGDLLWGLTRATQPRAVIETGTSAADTSIRIGEALRQNGHGVCATIEINATRAARATQRLAGLPVVVIQADATTMDWRAWAPAAAGIIDLAFVDGGDQRDREFARIHPHLAPGALVVFHDVANGTPPLATVQALADNGTLEAPLFVPTPRGLAIARLARCEPAKP